MTAEVVRGDLEALVKKEAERELVPLSRHMQAKVDRTRLKVAATTMSSRVEVVRQRNHLDLDSSAGVSG